MTPSSENGYHLNLQQLATGICQQINIFDPANQEFINKICWMIEGGAKIRLIYRPEEMTLQITGIRIRIQEDRPEKEEDDGSIATLKILDCGHKIHWVATIGHFDWKKNWNGKRHGEIMIFESREAFCHLFRLAHGIKSDHDLRQRERIRPVCRRLSISS